MCRREIENLLDALLFAIFVKSEWAGAEQAILILEDATAIERLRSRVSVSGNSKTLIPGEIHLPCIQCKRQVTSGDEMECTTQLNFASLYARNSERPTANLDALAEGKKDSTGLQEERVKRTEDGVQDRLCCRVASHHVHRRYSVHATGAASGGLLRGGGCYMRGRRRVQRVHCRGRHVQPSV